MAAWFFLFYMSVHACIKRPASIFSIALYLDSI